MTCRRRIVADRILYRCSMTILILTCRAKAQCDKPEPEGHVLLSDEAILLNSYPGGSAVTLECANGYEELSGSDTITCTDGAWSDVELVCRKKDCGPPRAPDHLSFVYSENGTLFGAYAKAVCDPGYQLYGATYWQCLARGWIGTANCFAVQCRGPQEIKNGWISDRVTMDPVVFGNVITYSCNDGYTLIGNRSLTCEANGQYSSLPPECSDAVATVADVTVTATMTTAAILLENEVEELSEYSADEAEINVRQHEKHWVTVGIAIFGTVTVALVIGFWLYKRNKRTGWVHPTFFFFCVPALLCGFLSACKASLALLEFGGPESRVWALPGKFCRWFLAGPCIFSTLPASSDKKKGGKVQTSVERY
uniref:Sushi domain-containing protein n=1 Tax=Denticeps clupeoides TaxID=299321 RepID=A0AAY4DLV2_9TELE